MSVQINKCPFCGGTELIHGYSAIYGESRLTGSILHHIVCRNCRKVVESYVDNPEMLLKKNGKNQ